MKTEDRERFVQLGYKATERVASGINAGNVNDIAAATMTKDLINGIKGCGSSAKLDPIAILRLQERCRMDLSSLLFLEGAEQLEAAVLFGNGCMQFSQDNPDE
jgi:hypothetical protein